MYDRCTKCTVRECTKCTLECTKCIIEYTKCTLECNVYDRVYKMYTRGQSV